MSLLMFYACKPLFSHLSAFQINHLPLTPPLLHYMYLYGFTFTFYGHALRSQSRYHARGHNITQAKSLRVYYHACGPTIAHRYINSHTVTCNTYAVTYHARGHSRGHGVTHAPLSHSSVQLSHIGSRSSDGTQNAAC
jgi:hypothetical protein